ncbi:hypothetical protein AURDEDRAFT_188137, partial [Auricularia subglabra TFB-10046 SS5]
MLIYRTTASPSWYGGYTSHTRIELGAEVSVADTGAEMRLVDARSAGWILTKGLENWDDANPPPQHCVILRSVRCRWRDRLRHGVHSVTRKAAETLHVTNSAGGGKLEASHSTAVTTPGNPGASTSGSTRAPKDSETQDDVNGSEDLSEGRGTDLLDAVLALVIESHPTVECAVGCWDIVSQFIADCEEYRKEHIGEVLDEWDALNQIEPVVEPGEGQTVYLIGIRHPWKGDRPDTQGYAGMPVRHIKEAIAEEYSDDVTLRQKLRSICKTLPRLWTESSSIPFDALFPYLDELKKAPKDDALSAFVESLEARYNTHRPQIEALLSTRKIKYEYLQHVFTPGTKIDIGPKHADPQSAGNLSATGALRAAVVTASEFVEPRTNNPYSQRPELFVVHYRMLEGEPAGLSWVALTGTIADFEGMTSIDETFPRPLTTAQIEGLTLSGHKFRKLMDNGGVNQVQISGIMKRDDFDSNTSSIFVKGRGMVDAAHCRHSASQDVFFRAGDGRVINKAPIELSEISEDMYWLLPETVRCFSFTPEVWGTVDVMDVELISRDEKAWDRLIVDGKDMIRAAVCTETASLPAPTILLSGPTKIGKTFTVETLAKALGRPLYWQMSVHLKFEWNAENAFTNFILDAAERWNAIMVFDNLEEMGTNQMHILQRFLRVETRRKIPVILITQQLSAIPPSLLRAVTFTFAFKVPDFKSRLKMWPLFLEDALQNIAQETKGAPMLEEQVADELSHMSFTPLAIKEVIQTALALAETRGETPALEHFREIATRKAQTLRDASLALRGDDNELPAVDDAADDPSSVWNWIAPKLRFVAQGFV